MILITLTLDILYELYQYFFIMPYIGGGIEPINEINDYWNFILVGYNASVKFFLIMLLTGSQRQNTVLIQNIV